MEKKRITKTMGEKPGSPACTSKSCPEPPGQDDPGNSNEDESDSWNNSKFDTALEDSNYETSPEYPEDDDSEENDNKGGTEEKEDKGKGREECLR